MGLHLAAPEEQALMLGFPLQLQSYWWQDFPTPREGLYQKCRCSLLFGACRGSGSRRWRTCHNRRMLRPDHPSCLFAARSAPGT